MDGLVTSKETGEGFVDKFSREWLALNDWDADQQLAGEFDWLNDFYSELQLYSASPAARQESSLLFELEHLLDLTSHAYARLKDRWCDALLRDERPQTVGQ
ncbi:MAG TPA: hypothetical protein VGP33_03205 [Chloroflexota bacterium]|jgi:hypothetical protein|nr:hypothetical protein [Chloroflexota bacterium]